MFSNSVIKKFVSIKNNLPKLDNKGGLLMPSSLKFEDSDFMKYRHIPVNWEIKSVSEDCLPEEFSPMAVKLVDMFRRKTIDLPYEIMLIFDYKTGDLIYCFVNDDGSGDEVFGVVDEDILFGRNICIIHNHPIEYGSSPSSENFQILGLKFQDFKLPRLVEAVDF